MIGEFHDLGQHAVGGLAGKDHARLGQPRFVGVVDLVAVAVALADAVGAVYLADAAVGAEHAPVRPQSHGAAHVPVAGAGFHGAVANPFGHQADHRFVAGTELGGAGALDAGHVARRLHHRHLHAETDTEVGHVAFAGEARRRKLARRAALAEAARHEDPVHPVQVLDGVLALEDLRIDPVGMDADVVGDAAVGQGLGQGLVGIEQAGVLADDGDADLALGLGGAVDDVAPAGQVQRRGVDGEMAAHLFVQPFFVVADGHLIDAVDVQGRDHGLVADVAEQRDLAPFGVRDLAVGPAQQHVRLDAHAQQLLHRVLGGLGLQFAGAGDERHQRQVQVHDALTAQFVAHLADGLEKRQAFDVADGAADLAQHEVLVLEVTGDERLDGVGDVGNHLDGGTQVIAAPFPGDDVGIDASRGDVVALARGDAGEALVVSEIEVGLGAVVGDVDLAVLIGAHGARIDVDVGVQFAQAHLEPAPLEQSPKGRRCQSLAE